MSKRFNGFLLINLLASLLVFVNCSDDGDDFTASDLISPYNVANSTWLAFTDNATSKKYTCSATGFSNPGSGYEVLAESGASDFTIVLTDGNVSYATYNQTQVDVEFVDAEGTSWVTGTESFTVTLYGWPDVGGKVSGVFSGTLHQNGVPANTKEIANGSFKLKVLN